MIRQGNLRGSKIAYPDGVGCTVWYPFASEGEDEETGLCFDFSANDIDDFIALLQTMKAAEAEPFVADEGDSLPDE